MATEETFTIGDEVICTDGVCGHVTRVVIDPVAEAVTHLVVKPALGNGLDRLAPIDLVEPAKHGAIGLRCSRAEFDRFDAAEETQLLQGNGPFGGYQSNQMYFLPYYGLGGMGMGGMGGMAMGMGGMGMGMGPEMTTYDTVPAGDVAVRRGDAVQATDGPIGHVQGLVVDPATHHISHILLQEGHLWGRREVSIPIGAVTNVDDGIALNLSRKQVEELPPVEIDHSKI